MKKEQTEPLISLVVPVYNVRNYLEKCLQSVVGQTYANLEIILVDDGSSDGSAVICDEYARADRRVKVIHLPHAGVSAARNAGLEAATGALLGFVDSDDYIDADIYEYLYRLLTENDADISACTYLLEQEGRPSKEVNNTGALRVFSQEGILRELVRNDLVKNYLWGKLFKRRLFDGISFPVGRTYEDVAVLYKVFYNSQKVVLSCVSKYHYMIHQNESITRGSYDPVKEYHFFLSLYEQDCFLRQAAKFGNESGINALKRGIHLVNHTFLCPDSPAYAEILDDAMKKIREYNHIPSRELGFSLAVRRYLLCRHYTLYRQLYCGFRSLFKRRHKSMMD